MIVAETSAVAMQTHGNDVLSRSDRRRLCIVEVAGQMFLEDGYAATSMSAIAARLGGSKATLYSYFTSKEALFVAYMHHACAGLVADVFGFSYASDDVTDTLTVFAKRYITLILSKPAIAIFRLVVAEAGRFPELGKAFYEAGPRQGIVKLGAILEQHMHAGRLKIMDPTLAAWQFIGLFQWTIDRVRLFIVTSDITDTEINVAVEAAVKTFLHGLGVGAS